MLRSIFFDFDLFFFSLFLYFYKGPDNLVPSNQIVYRDMTKMLVLCLMSKCYIPLRLLPTKDNFEELRHLSRPFRLHTWSFDIWKQIG